jgi:hypothetical protein
MPRPPIRWLPLVAAFALLALAGCDREEIDTYKVPKQAQPAEENVRLLAAVFDVGDDQWYFKIVGPVKEVDKHAEAFARFVESARFTQKADKPVEWTVPKEWKQGEARKPRYATFYPDPDDRALELTVFQFDRVSPLVDNVNRWCDLDLGLPHFRKADLDRLKQQGKITDVKAGTKTGQLVDLRGPGAKKRAHPPMGGMGKGKDLGRPLPIEKEPKAGKSPITYTTPAGWTDTGPRAPQSQFDTPKAATFTIREGAAAADVTVSLMPGTTVADVANVTRWRGLVGLGPLSPAEVSKITPRELKVDGLTGKLYEFAGQKQTTLLVLVHRDRLTWFLKLHGDNDAVSKNREKFTSFVQSVKFTGGAE